MRVCKICGNEIKTSIRGTKCSPCNVKLKHIRFKIYGVKKLGGKCVKCGWQGSFAGYEFHHIENETTNMKNITHKGWETFKKELEKCELVCSNCHQIHHSSVYDNPSFIQEIKTYKGKEKEIIKALEDLDNLFPSN